MPSAILQAEQCCHWGRNFQDFQSVPACGPASPHYCLGLDCLLLSCQAHHQAHQGGHCPAPGHLNTAALHRQEPTATLLRRYRRGEMFYRGDWGMTVTASLLSLLSQAINYPISPCLNHLCLTQDNRKIQIGWKCIFCLSVAGAHPGCLATRLVAASEIS